MLNSKELLIYFLEEMRTLKTYEEFKKAARKYWPLVDAIADARKEFPELDEEFGKIYKTWQRLSREERKRQELILHKGGWECSNCQTINPKDEPYCTRCSVSK